MTEIENEIETPVDSEIDTDEDISTPSEDKEITLEDYYKSEKSRKGAEKNWVEPTKWLLKEYGVKTVKELKEKLSSQKTAESSYITREDMALRDFIKDNPEIKDYESDIKEYTKKGISFEEAKILIERKDKTIDNRRKLSSMNVSDWEWTSFNTSYSTEEIEKMDDKAYAEFKKLQSQWKVKRV